MILTFNLVIFALGLAVGSFLNCVIYRLTLPDFSFWKSLGGLNRSYCPKCRHQLAWENLIPVFSFLFQRGRCRYCAKKISVQYPMVEMATGLIFLLIFNDQFSIINQFSILKLLNIFFLFYIASSLIIIFVHDLRHYIIPDKILLSAVIISFSYRLFESLYNWGLVENRSLKIENFYDFGNYLLAALAASGFFLAIYLLSKGEWLGFGDVKLAVLLGLVLGLPAILTALFLAFLFGAIIGITAILLKKKGLKSQVPFAPFLIAGTFTALFWGNKILYWYLSSMTPHQIF